MALKTTRKAAPTKAAPERPPLLARLRRWLARGLLALAGLFAAFVVLFALVNPPTTITILGERLRLGEVQREWVGWDRIAPVMARAAVAAEDANFCLHWGFDMAAIRAAVDGGGRRGASTISQQVVKNVFLWQGRSWTRKALEAMLTPAVELVWTKRRILEVYLNIAEFGEGVFGVQAAAQRFFGVDAAALTPVQAARLAAVLPDPKRRDPAAPGPFVRKRAAQVVAGAETIAVDGRAACFEE